MRFQIWQIGRMYNVSNTSGVAVLCLGELRQVHRKMVVTLASFLLVFLSAGRSPDTSRVKAKMLYASSKERFRRELEGVHYELQATDPTEMDIEVIKERAN